MRLINWLIVLSALYACMGCIRKEPLNAECDITEVTVPGNVLSREPIIENNRITLIVKADADISDLAPLFELTPGATIQPASGTPRDFNQPQTYTVTSEDGEWHKEYTIIVQRNNTVELEYTFDHVTLHTSKKYAYDIFYEVGADGEETIRWGTANPGFAMSGEGTMDPSSFPTYQVEGGVDGYAAQLTTRLTGTWGAMMNRPLAAGNLFLGFFDSSYALTNTLYATQFGIQFSRVPTVLSGYYKYTPGDTYYKMNDKKKLEAVPGKVDMFNIYAVFFESLPGKEHINGTNVLANDNPQIVATAEFDPDKRTPSNEWKPFNIPFVLRPGKTVDPQKLAEGKYSITIVFVSSADGDEYAGAPGSTLTVDEVTLTCRNEQ